MAYFSFFSVIGMRSTDTNLRSERLLAIQLGMFLYCIISPHFDIHTHDNVEKLTDQEVDFR